MVGANIRSMPVVQLDSETTSQLLIQVEPSNQVFTIHPPLLNIRNPSIDFIIFCRLVYLMVSYLNQILMYSAAVRIYFMTISFDIGLNRIILSDTNPHLWVRQKIINMFKKTERKWVRTLIICTTEIESFHCETCKISRVLYRSSCN
jgi:hypothetical protein